MSNYLVAGAGVTGCVTALELALQGQNVTILEATGRAGGKILSYCCKATDSCSRCGVCVAHSRIAEALAHPLVETLTGARIESVEHRGGRVAIGGAALNPRISHRKCIDCEACAIACPAGCITRYSRGGFTAYGVELSACLLRKGASCAACLEACPTAAITVDGPESPFSLEVDGALIATGHETFDPRVRPRLGYGRIAGVMTGLEAEQMLARQAFLSADGGAGGGAPAKHAEPAARVAFIQCVGSRDPHLGRNFCSSVCCAYALRMSRILKHRRPETDVTIYFIDIQNFDKVFTPFRSELERMGVRFVRGIPFSVTRASAGGLSLLIEDPDGGRTTASHDVVVLSVGMSPADGAGRMAELFGLARDEFGFYSSTLPNVLVAGTCAEPQGIVDSVASARAAAWELLKATAAAEAQQLRIGSPA